jgi:hypothetical protein
MPTPAIPIMHTDKAKTLCTAREVPVTGSQRFILSAIYQGSTKTSNQTSVSFRGSTPCNPRGVHINFSEAAFLSAIKQRQSMHWRIARIERGHMGGGVAITSHRPAATGAWPPPPAAAAGQPRQQRLLPPARISQELSLEEQSWTGE